LLTAQPFDSADSPRELHHTRRRESNKSHLYCQCYEIEVGGMGGTCSTWEKCEMHLLGRIQGNRPYV